MAAIVTRVPISHLPLPLPLSTPLPSLPFPSTPTPSVYPPPFLSHSYQAAGTEGGAEEEKEKEGEGAAFFRGDRFFTAGKGKLMELEPMVSQALLEHLPGSDLLQNALFNSNSPCSGKLMELEPMVSQGKLMELEPMVSQALLEHLPGSDLLQNALFNSCAIVGNSGFNLLFRTGSSSTAMTLCSDYLSERSGKNLH
ncbi:unnamed protein product [Closterium sp. NIES-65]|nr:unnamed protein product [Closterium sp. NIES-65]